MTVVDVHQHLWPEPLLELLRARRTPPYLRGWVLHTAGEPAYDVRPADHDPDRRHVLDDEAGVGSACLSLSAPLGIEGLPSTEAEPLLDAWHDGLDQLPDHFSGWASVQGREPDLDGLRRRLDQPRIVGLQVPATDLLTPHAWERSTAALEIAQALDRPVMVHPGPVPPVSSSETLPGWWPAVVPYTAQLAASWWAWQAWHGREQLPELRVVFTAGAGLGPLHHERHVARGGQESPVDPLLFVDTSGYGPRAWDALVRVLGIDVLVLGSDRPYGAPVRELFGAAATHAVRVANPARLLGVAPPIETGGGASWSYAR